MTFNLPFHLRPSENTLIALVFAAIFITGLGVFSLSSSVVVSSAFLAVSALAAYGIAKQRAAPQTDRSNISPDDMDRFIRRLSALEGTIQTIDTRLNGPDAAVHEQVAKQIQPLVDTVQIMADILSHTSRRDPVTTEERRPQEAAKAPVNPLQHRRTEALIRDSLQSGKLSTATRDIIALPTARPAYRILTATLNDQQRSPMGESDLRAEGLPPSIIQLFDRVRFAHAFELASRLTAAADSPVLVCPLTLETLDDGVAGVEIADLLSRSAGIAQRICFLLSEDVLFLNIGIVGENIRQILRAGCTFAVELKNDIRIDPFILQSKGVSLLLAPANLVLATREGRAQSDIDPSDLVDLLDRHMIDLGISAIESDAQLRAIRALGINLIMRRPGQIVQHQPVKLRPEPKAGSGRLPRTAGLEEPQNPPIRLEPEPLKARLRRMSA